MPKKVGRKPEDVAKLAESLRDRWEAADGIEPWLRRNRVRFERMVQRERWTWVNLADALTQAGITYGSGRPWKGHTLATKVSEIRVREKAEADRDELERRRALDAPLQSQATAPEPLRSDPEPLASAHRPVTEQPSPEPPDAAEAERERLRAKFGTGSTLRNSKSASAPQQPAPAPVTPSEPPQRSEQEIDEYLARVMGRAGAPRKP